MEFREHVLDNGLEIIAECNPQAYTMGVGFFVKTGSRDETDGLSMEFHDWRFNLRSSATEPLLRLNAETRGSHGWLANRVSLLSDMILEPMA